MIAFSYAILQEFLSTPSARRATHDAGDGAVHVLISIHALREEGDHKVAPHVFLAVHISIHALREEGDHNPDCGGHAEGISIHALREEGDAFPVRFCDKTDLFLSTPSARRATYKESKMA